MNILRRVVSALRNDKPTFCRREVLAEARKWADRDADAEEAAAQEKAPPPTLLDVAEMARTIAAAMEEDHGVHAASALALAMAAQRAIDNQGYVEVPPSALFRT